MNGLIRKCRVPLSFALWYCLNILYNLTNKWALENVRAVNGKTSLPITIGSMQLAVGTLYVCVLWITGIRRPVPHLEEVKAATKACIGRIKVVNCIASVYPYSSLASPKNSPSQPKLRDTVQIAIHHTFGQLCTVLSLSLNSIGFAHVIKAMGPFFSVIVDMYYGKRMDIRIYLALIPVVGGVIMAISGSDEFSWLAVCFGMASNIFFAIRAAVSKIAMSQSANISIVGQTVENQTPPSGTVISASNLFAAVTVVSFFFSIPLVAIFEGQALYDMKAFLVADHITADSHDIRRTIVYILSSGIFHYLNNEVMYLVLADVDPITLAVGNTLKRVFIIISGVIVFSTPVTWQTAIGSSIGIGGVLLYSLMKRLYDRNPNKDDLDNQMNKDAELVTELVQSSLSDSVTGQHLVSRKHIMKI